VWPTGAYICCLFPLQPAHIVEESVMSEPDRSVSVQPNTLMHCKASAQESKSKNAG
jgi:hypothetical protein